MRRVAVTGLGRDHAARARRPVTWRAALAGESGVDWIEAFDPSDFPVRIAGEVKGFDATDRSPRPRRRGSSSATCCSRSAPADEAIADAGLNGFDPDRVGIIFGSAIGGVIGDRRAGEILRERGCDRVSPSFLPNVLVDTARGQIAISLGIKGPNYAVVSACATGSHAIGEARRDDPRGDADAVIAGGTEACIHPLVLAGFCAMRGLAARTRTRRARRGRSTRRAHGFVMAEGAGAVAARGAGAAPRRAARRSTPRCSATAPRTTRTTWRSPSPTPMGVAAMMRARARARRRRAASASATSTRTAPARRSATRPRRRRSRSVFGDHAYQLAVSSTKSMMGHTFGAAGAIEAIMCVLAHPRRHAPADDQLPTSPTRSATSTTSRTRRASVDVDVALSNAMGLGGHNGCVLLGRA